ncbi:metallo-beta-lactamase family protein [Desulfuromusa kysingii]|uniref:Metallo-beta-lactamase family protein n=1 Tax=Desulfuromusa kysingii TaxID=37625 RepID=A0A1H4BB78_9BACT|nr:MBL fold metallo-hydrolase [Desulfuromusa kysingii]SEA45400.1 metallo-beta-lactamase family protein [Desulfuromusa kysingii]
MYPHIHFHGATQGVTGSCHELIYAENASILIDCGLFQGDEQQSQEINFSIEQVKALIVTHVHIDHVGRIPYLLAAGFNGPIYCSEASAVLLPLVLEDAVKIGFTRNRRLIDQFLNQLKKLIVPVPFQQWQTISPAPDRLKIKLKPAGHILGSAYVECHVSGQRVVFSGDLGAPYAPLLPAPQSPYRADTLILESTYGNRNHSGRRERKAQLKQVIEKALSDRGTILIPAFSIGRTQELLYELEDLIHRHRTEQATSDLPWDDLEIIIDSPLASRFTDAYKKLFRLWDAEARHRYRSGRHPLAFEQMTTIDTHQDHLHTVAYLQKTARPCIVIAGSGMCSGGRIVNYLKALLGDPRTDVLFVGYQAEGTPGQKIQQYGPAHGYVILDSQRYDIAAGVYTMSGYSAHADQRNLINFVKRMRHKPEKIYLVHGDSDAKQKLKEQLQLLSDEFRVMIPR